MYRYSILIIAVLVSCLNFACNGQGPYYTDQQLCLDPVFDDRVRSSISFSVPVIGAEELSQTLENYTILDAREFEEYQASHIPGARYIGYNAFDIKETLKEVPKDKPLLVYCSIGYRSEKIGERLQKAGYENVTNLYGSIFEWVNRGNPVVDMKGEVTNEVHTYSKRWGRWVKNKKIKKVY